MGEQDNKCFWVERVGEKDAQGKISTVSQEELPSGDLLVEVAYSSLNYKDALAAHGHPGIAPNLPHIPGIDAVGTVRHSTDSSFPTGAKVFINGHDFGSKSWGGWARFCRVPAAWAISIPDALSPLETITHGTAGFTAAQCVEALLLNGLKPESGPIVVTGSTGGVGCISVAILAKLGFEVTAVTGKADQIDWLKSLGASQVVGREALQDDSGKPLLKGLWAGGVDTVGGKPLSTLIKQTKHSGCVAACGLAASHELDVTVYPFILRGVTLAGIDSAWVRPDVRLGIWQKLANEYRVESLDQIRQVCQLEEVSVRVEAMLNGQIHGRTVVQVSGAPESLT